MGLARGMERRLERLVDGFAARLFRGRLHPVELGNRLVREADLGVFDTPAGPGAPNAFTVTLGGRPEPPETVAEAERALEATLADVAAEQGWRLEGPPRVRIVFGPGPASATDVAGEVEAGEAEPFAVFEGVEAVTVVRNRSVVGRGSAADVRLPGDDVSRRHALLWREAGSLWLADLGSANGTFVGGERITEPVEVVDGDRLTFGATTVVLRVL